MKKNKKQIPDFPSWLTSHPDILKSEPAAIANLIAALFDGIDENLAIWKRWSGDPDAAFDLLAAWGKLQRMRSDLDLDPGDRILAESLNELVVQDGDELRRAAVIVPSPQCWLRAADRLDKNIHAMESMESMASLAQVLIEELDDAELICYALRVAGVNESKLEDGLEHCRSWVADHAEIFIAASGYVATIAAMLKDELFDTDPDLALTTFKFGVVLDEVVKAMAFVNFEGIEAIPDSVRRILSKNLAVEPNLIERLETIIKSLEPTIRELVTRRPSIPGYKPVMATGDAPGAKEEGEKLTWRGLERSWQAFIRLPASSDAEDASVVTLWIKDIEDVQSVFFNGRVYPAERTEHYLKVQLPLGQLRMTSLPSQLPTLALLLSDGAITIGQADIP